MDHVTKYRQLDERATTAESKAQTARWEQCRIAHEAVGSGMSRRAFAKAVGYSDVHIGVQVRMWERWGARDTLHLPDHREAYAEIENKPTGPRATFVAVSSNLHNMSDEDTEDIVASIAAKRPAVVARAQARAATTPRPEAPFTSPPIVGNSDRVAVLTEDRATVARLTTAVHVFGRRVTDAHGDSQRCDELLQGGTREAALLAMALDVLRGLGDPDSIDWEAAQ